MPRASRPVLTRRKIRQQRDCYQLAFQAAPVPLALLDTSGLILEANPAFQRLLGYGAEELAGARFDDVVEPHDPTHGDVRSIRQRDGSRVHARVTVGTLTGTGDIPVSAVVSLEHISSVGHVAADPGDDDDAVRQRDAYLATVAHDLKAPLTAIKGRTELLQRRVDALTAALNEGLSHVNDAANRMATQLDEVLLSANGTARAQAQFYRRPTDLVALVRKVVEEQALQVDQHSIVVQTELNELIGQWHAPRLERAIANLVGNAIKYTPPGGEIVVQVERHTGDSPAWASVSVHDPGIGISPEDLPRIFDRFYRGRNVGEIVGSGIGLAGARLVVEQHGGSIHVCSQPGVGSTFTIRLPLSPPDTRPLASD